nr:hypothetical protein [Rhodopirellula sp.]
MNMNELIHFEGETFQFESAKITDVTLNDDGGTINITGHQKDYGLIYLTYHLKENPNHNSQGSFNGRAVGLSADGQSVPAVLNGVWSRKGHTLTMYSLDDVSDGNLYFAVIKVNLVEETADIYFSSFDR